MHVSVFVSTIVVDSCAVCGVFTIQTLRSRQHAYQSECEDVWDYGMGHSTQDPSIDAREKAKKDIELCYYNFYEHFSMARHFRKVHTMTSIAHVGNELIKTQHFCGFAVLLCVTRQMHQPGVVILSSYSPLLFTLKNLFCTEKKKLAKSRYYYYYFFFFRWHRVSFTSHFCRWDVGTVCHIRKNSLL